MALMVIIYCILRAKNEDPRIYMFIFTHTNVSCRIYSIKYVMYEHVRQPTSVTSRDTNNFEECSHSFFSGHSCSAIVSYSGIWMFLPVLMIAHSDYDCVLFNILNCIAEFFCCCVIHRILYE